MQKESALQDYFSTVDFKKIMIPYNWVLVKLDPDHKTYHSTETGNDTGIYVAPFGANQASHVSLTGEIVCLPNSLQFFGREMAAIKRIADRSEEKQKEVAELRRQSMAYDVPIEPKVGMKVYFEYRTRLNAFKEGRAIENEDGKFVFIPYDLLVMLFRPGTNMDNVGVGDVYMLNGFVLIKPLEYATEKDSSGIEGVKTASDIFMPAQEEAKYVHRDNLWYGSVLTSGCCVKGYADFPDQGDDRRPLPAGLKIAYDGRHQKRLEVDHHRVIFKKHRLYRIHRKDILSIFPDGKIN